MNASRLLFLPLVFIIGCIGNPTTAPNAVPTPPATTGPASCSAGQDWCHGSCVDTITFVNDNDNCGRCGNRCSYNQQCTGGFCQCGPGYDSCMGQCKSMGDYIIDNQNCGRCGNICGVGESCIGGSCRKL